jgi:hypothetical protein
VSGGSRLSPKVPRKQLIKFSSLFLVIVIVFAGSLLLGTGGLTGLNNAPRDVVVGDFSFAYPARWRRMHRADYPAQSGSAQLNQFGTIMLGVCPHGSVAKQCKARPGVLHVLFFESASLPTTDGAIKALDKSLPKRFKAFKRITASVGATSDGSKNVRYEFQFRRGRMMLREIVSLYPAADTGAIAIVQGSVAEMKKRSRTIAEVLNSAHEQA